MPAIQHFPTILVTKACLARRFKSELLLNQTTIIIHTEENSPDSF